MSRATSNPDNPSTKGHVIHWARAYDRLVQLVSLGREDRFRSEIIETAGLEPGQRILDVGCGTGTLALAAAKVVGTEGRVQGIDPSPEMIARAQAKAEDSGCSAKFQVGAIEALAFADASFDVVLSSLMFHHLPDDLKSAGLAEIHRVLAPGGRLVIIDFAGPGPLFHRLAGLFGHQKSSGGSYVDQVVAETKAAGFREVATSRLRQKLLFSLIAQTA
ncbi:MAG: methyltransferase domain-containing protein [bacterium]|nr:methyltransferase domain-containing protein [bacterium]